MANFSNLSVGGRFMSLRLVFRCDSVAARPAAAHRVAFAVSEKIDNDSDSGRDNDSDSACVLSFVLDLNC